MIVPASSGVVLVGDIADIVVARSEAHVSLDQAVAHLPGRVAAEFVFHRPDHIPGVGILDPAEVDQAILTVHLLAQAADADLGLMREGESLLPEGAIPDGGMSHDEILDLRIEGHRDHTCIQRLDRDQRKPPGIGVMRRRPIPGVVGMAVVASVASQIAARAEGHFSVETAVLLRAAGALGVLKRHLPDPPATIAIEDPGPVREPAPGPGVLADGQNTHPHWLAHIQCGATIGGVAHPRETHRRAEFGFHVARLQRRDRVVRVARAHAHIPFGWLAVLVPVDGELAIDLDRPEVEELE